MDRKFGLAELNKLADEIKVGKGDIRTIKVVLAVTGAERARLEKILKNFA